MKHSSACRFVLLLGWIWLTVLPLRAEEHRATRLGHPATRFAPPLRTPEDLRARFRDEKLRPDFASVLYQWGWKGDLDDLFRAAASAEIVDGKIAIGTRMPFMSSRKDGVAICLRNVIWAGTEPAPAYAFDFASKGRRYRCITPKACSNFFVEDLGPAVVPMPLLAVHCTAPERQFTGRPVKVCFTVRNNGDGPEPRATLTVPIPAGASVASVSDGGVIGIDRITWELADLPPASPREVCANFTTERPGRMDFTSTFSCSAPNTAHCECRTQILGVYAVLVEVVDVEDPVAIGDPVNYIITVTNQGNQTATNVRVVCTVPDSQDFISGSGHTPVTALGRTVMMSPLATLEGKGVATWRVQTRARSAADSRFKVEFTSDQFTNPIRREESTRLF